MSRCGSLGLCAPNALSSLSLKPRSVKSTLSITSHSKANDAIHHNVAKMRAKAGDFFGAKKTILAAQLGTVLATIDHPALAITGVNNQQELSSVVLDIAIISVWYFLVMPPIIINWLRVRWYRRKFFEMYLQFMFVFLFFPGLLIWAPFLNFRKFPRDPSMKNPWDIPADPSSIKNGYLKYPFAKPEDYDLDS
ncbi:PREDICTED: NAD(P)H-quinone oxidoreductase subunit L, chloroplastic [Camelina sativa]|uniref:NAD(P)H-quinone oxidoreductase subunit L, chloroplastic n=1 Tax=Camelina sativa TaxID=90675 RepID=A0ABM0ST62_CAMSA|nr:PREDICTED: NAD(P)H-quinone oxidoreductase subunit L, chloroplastic [Camelina sativa]